VTTDETDETKKEKVVWYMSNNIIVLLHWDKYLDSDHGDTIDLNTINERQKNVGRDGLYWNSWECMLRDCYEHNIDFFDFFKTTIDALLEKKSDELYYLLIIICRAFPEWVTCVEKCWFMEKTLHYYAMNEYEITSEQKYELQTVIFKQNMNLILFRERAKDAKDAKDAKNAKNEVWIEIIHSKLENLKNNFTLLVSNNKFMEWFWDDILFTDLAIYILFFFNVFSKKTYSASQINAVLTSYNAHFWTNLQFETLYENYIKRKQDPKRKLDYRYYNIV
jgi:hypothetical protein